MRMTEALRSAQEDYPQSMSAKPDPGDTLGVLSCWSCWFQITLVCRALLDWAVLTSVPRCRWCSSGTNEPPPPIGRMTLTGLQFAGGFVEYECNYPPDTTQCGGKVVFLLYHCLQVPDHLLDLRDSFC